MSAIILTILFVGCSISMVGLLFRLIDTPPKPLIDSIGIASGFILCVLLWVIMLCITISVWSGL